MGSTPRAHAAPSPGSTASVTSTTRTPGSRGRSRRSATSVSVIVIGGVVWAPGRTTRPSPSTSPSAATSPGHRRRPATSVPPTGSTAPPWRHLRRRHRQTANRGRGTATRQPAATLEPLAQLAQPGPAIRSPWVPGCLTPRDRYLEGPAPLPHRTVAARWTLDPSPSAAGSDGSRPRTDTSRRGLHRTTRRSLIGQRPSRSRSACRVAGRRQPWCGPATARATVSDTPSRSRRSRGADAASGW